MFLVRCIRDCKQLGVAERRRRTEMRMLEGDALDHLPAAIATTPDPLCVFHSACLFYWPSEARARLDCQLREASRTRPIWRIAIEPSFVFAEWDAQNAGEPAMTSAADRNLKIGGISLIRYRDGTAARQVLGWPNAEYGIIDWVE